MSNNKVQSWQYLMLQQIIDSVFAEIVLVIHSRNNDRPRKKSFFSAFLLRTYTALESNLTRQKPAFGYADASMLLKQVPVLNTISITENDDLQQLVFEDILKIKAHEPSVLINLTGYRFKGEILKVAEHGLWAYDPPGDFRHSVFRNALINNNPDWAITLKKYDFQSPEGVVLYESFSAKNILLSKTINWQYWKAASFVLRELNQTGGVRNCHKSLENRPAVATSSGSIMLFLAKQFFLLLQKKFFRMGPTEQWAFYFNPANTALLNFDFLNYHKIQPPSDRFWADPCVFSLDNRNHYVFFEEYIYAKKKAHISVLHLNKNNKTPEAIRVLEKDYHLSYPFVFSDKDDNIYMIPESSANNSIDLYKCESFPGKWEFVMNLINNVHAVDTTVHFIDNMYWMFTGIRANPGASDWDELCIFFSDKLLTSEWHAHPCNPVVSDVRKARPAGNIFSQNGKFYRPSQDCSKTYGYAININEIVTLSVTEYIEKKVGSIEPWRNDISAVHSYFTFGDVSVVDARIKTM